MIQIINDGPEIVSSSFWESEWNERGYIGCSLNAGALRLLIPDSLHDLIPEMLTGKDIIVSKGLFQGKPGYEFLFDDHTDTPFSLHISEGQMMGFIPADTEDRKAIVVSVWVRGPEKVLDVNARFRVVDTLPCLKPYPD